MRIAIGTLNKAKTEAVKNIIEKVWPGSQYFSVQTDSKIRAQPLSDEEGIEGAINRANQALEKFSLEVDYGIGLEGTVDTNKYGMFLSGWVAIINKKGEVGIGCSGKVLMPEYLKQKLDQGNELGPIVQNLLNDPENKIRHSSGTNGLLTNNLYTRVREFEDATLCALGKFVAPKIYQLK